MFVEPDNTYINKLRATSGARDPLALRIRLERALAGARLHPPGLPASAILCVRKLRDPLPGGLRIEGGSLQAPPAWERAVAESLDRLVRRAARPAQGFVPINAESVVFLDRPEFLACLAQDWLEGAAATRWWWRSIFEAMDATDALMRAWMEAPEYAPLALARLAGGGHAVKFVSSLSAGDSRSLLTGIIRRFALRELANALDVALNENGTARRDANAAAPQMLGSARAPQRPPWQRWVRETEARELEIAQESLLTTGLMLVRAPATVRSRAFAEAVMQWYRGGAADLSNARRITGLAGAKVTPEADAVSATKLASGAVETGAERDSSNDTLFVAAERTEPDRKAELPIRIDGATAAEGFDKIRSRAIEKTIEAGSAPPVASAPERTVSPVREPARTNAPSPNPGEPSEVADQFELLTGPSSHSELVFEAEIETGFGGVFYLINLGLFLNLYGDFTTPAQPGIELSIWDFVALAGRHLSEGKVEADPVWALLAQLAGRGRDDPPGKEFNPPDDWRLRGEWLAPFEEECTWVWESADDRLRVMHPEGFVVLDVSLKVDAEKQLMRETRGYKGPVGFEFCSRSASAEARSISTLERWLGWLMPYLRARLARALGLPVGAALRGRPRSPDPHSGAATEGRPYMNNLSPLLEHHARVVVTATHLDVFFSLDEHPIEIRLAGLDRDPGWVPAAGRYITFHYE